jgi:hypothetical protein
MEQNLILIYQFSSKSAKGGLNVIVPNYNYSDKSLRLNLSRASNDFLSTMDLKILSQTLHWVLGLNTNKIYFLHH